MRILFVSANPDWEPCLDLLDELRELNQSLKGKKYKLELLPAAQPDDLRQAIDGSDTEIDILHFSGHATEEDGLLFRHNRGDSEPLTAGDLTTMFGEKSVKLAVLNACNTESIANEITGFAKNVIGTTAKLEDISAKKFTKVLYAGLGNGKSIDEAFEDVGQTFDKTGLTNIYERIRSPHWDPEEITFAAGELETDQENVDAWNRYFYEGYLTEQIVSVEATINRDRKIAWGLVGFGVAIAALLTFRYSWDLNSIFSVLPDLSPDSDEARTTAYEQWVDFSGEHMLESITKYGNALAALIAGLAGRLVAHGNSELRSLAKLLEMVKSSSEMPQNMRDKLFSIVGQNMFSALTMTNQQSEVEGTE
jgi:hypothetical protein